MNSHRQVETELKSKNSLYPNYIKRLLDVFISLLLLVVLSPVMLLTSLLILLESGRPVFFRQERVGYKGKVFQIYKFRSMVQNAEHTGSGVYSGKDDARVTRVGKFLRASSIDELPQLVNILKGDMALIGPRPPLTYHPWTYDKYSKEQLHMFDARPGITGWAQINGLRGDTSIPQRIRYDIYYIEHWSLAFDMKILFRTVFGGKFKNEESMK